MKTLLRVVMVIAAAAAARSYLQGRPPASTGGAPSLAYKDTAGAEHSLSSPAKPAVVVLWVTPCPYCARALNVLDALRRDYPEESLDVVGFYLNRAAPETVDQIARQEGHSITMAQGQPTGAFVQSLVAGLEFRLPGRDIYVIGKDGRYEKVDASDLNVPDDQIDRQVRTLLRDKHGVKARAG